MQERYNQLCYAKMKKKKKLRDVWRKERVVLVGIQIRVINPVKSILNPSISISSIFFKRAKLTIFVLIKTIDIIRPNNIGFFPAVPIYIQPHSYGAERASVQLPSPSSSHEDVEPIFSRLSSRVKGFFYRPFNSRIKMQRNLHAKINLLSFSRLAAQSQLELSLFNSLGDKWALRAPRGFFSGHCFQTRLKSFRSIDETSWRRAL